MNTHCNITVWRFVLTFYFSADKNGVTLRLGWYNNKTTE